MRTRALLSAGLVGAAMVGAMLSMGCSKKSEPGETVPETAAGAAADTAGQAGAARDSMAAAEGAYRDSAAAASRAARDSAAGAAAAYGDSAADGRPDTTGVMPDTTGAGAAVDSVR